MQSFITPTDRRSMIICIVPHAIHLAFTLSLLIAGSANMYNVQQHRKYFSYGVSYPYCVVLPWRRYRGSNDLPSLKLSPSHIDSRVAADTLDYCWPNTSEMA